MDWGAWHGRYAHCDSLQSRRLPVVRAHIREFLASRADTPRVISICAGDGRDLLGTLEDMPEPDCVHALLVELSPELAGHAVDRARDARLDGVEVRAADAGVTDAYADAVPADLVLACGVFGNISDRDVERTVRTLPQLCAEGGTVVWTRHRRDPDLTPHIRAWFADAGFREHAFDSPGPDSFAVGVHILDRPPDPFEPGRRLFTFSG